MTLLDAPTVPRGAVPRPIASAEEIIDEARAGRMVILADDEGRDSEGGLVVPAQMASADAVNFMATHGRGLICLALTETRGGQLGLAPMVKARGAGRDTAFTGSIEAAHGVTTGISAADRARTVAVAIDADMGPEAIVSPGHVFPLIARPGGVLAYPGRAEAAVDIARLAGLNPSGVVCEILRDDGRMARRADLLALAERHGLKVGTIGDLVAYRRRHDHLMEKVHEAPFTSDQGGEWRVLTYRNGIDLSEVVVLQKGAVQPGRPTLARVHVTSLLDDLLGRSGGRNRLLQRAMAEIAEARAGVIVVLPHQPAADLEPDVVHRAYSVGAQVLADLGVRDLVLLSGERHAPVDLAEFGLNVIGNWPIRA